MTSENLSIEKTIRKITIKQMETYDKVVTPESSFINDLGADSLDIAELFMEFEDEFDMNIPEGDVEKIRTVGDAVNYIISAYTEK